MPSSRKIKAHVLVKDIRAGKAGSDMMEKHELSRKGFHYLLQRLLNADAISRDEYERTISDQVTSEEVEEEWEVDSAGFVSRRFPRIRTDRAKVFISDVYEPTNRGRLLDISQGGVESVGLKTAAGEIKDLEITFAGFPRSSSMSFEAECKWTAKEAVSGQCMAGFEITMISDEAIELLRQLIQTYLAAKSTNRKFEFQALHWIDGKWTADPSTKTKRATWLTMMDK